MRQEALMGHTGLVGGILSRQHTFSACFNTSNVDAMAGRSFDTVVCAAAPGSMFMANRAPDQDRAQVHALMDRLEAVQAQRFVLISSIAVLADFAAGDDEGTEAFQTALAYGRHRRELEVFCESHFDDCLIVRLPALFGTGLRKNFIFDLLHPVPSLLTQARFEALQQALPQALRPVLERIYSPESQGLRSVQRQALALEPDGRALASALLETGLSATQFHHPETTYQFYALDRLWGDIGVATQQGLTHLHLATEPLRAGDIHHRLLGTEMPASEARIHHENMHTRHAGLWGRQGPYLEDGDTVLEKLAVFFRSHKGSA